MNELIDRFNAVPLTNKIILLVLLMIGIAVGFFVFLYGPMNEEISQMQTDIVELEERERELEGVEDQQAEVEHTIERLEDGLAHAEEILPDSAEIPELLESVYREAEMQGLTIETFQRLEEEPASGANYIAIPVQMELVGTFDEIANFFSAVGQRRRIINIEDITLNREAGDLSSDGELIVTARATTYRWSPDES